MKTIFSLILAMKFFSLSVSANQNTILETEKRHQRNQLILQVLKNTDGKKLKTALKEILPSSDYSYVDQNIPDKIEISFKFDKQTIILNSNNKIVLGKDQSMVINGVRVTYNWSESFENNAKEVAEKSKKFGLINILLMKPAHAAAGLIAGAAIDYIVPAVILSIVGTNTISYGLLSTIFFNQTYFDNARIYCARGGRLAYDQSANSFGQDLPEDKIIKAALSEYIKKNEKSQPCTEASATEVQKQVRILASESSKKIRSDEVRKRAAMVPIKGTAVPTERQGTAH